MNLSTEIAYYGHFWHFVIWPYRNLRILEFEQLEHESIPNFSTWTFSDLCAVFGNLERKFGNLDIS